jgi:hypothetical protein
MDFFGGKNAPSLSYLEGKNLSILPYLDIIF